jgi:hypothetical protein
MSKEFDLEAFLSGKVRRGTVVVPGSNGMEIKVQELSALKRLQILSEYSEIQQSLARKRKDAVLAAERIKANGKDADPADIRTLQQYNLEAAPFMAALISAITTEPHLTKDEVMQVMAALTDTEMQEFMSA